MKLNKLVQQCFDTFPTLYQNREQVLDHLYCVLGNGYEWGTDGTIGYPRGEKHPKRTLREVVSEEIREIYLSGTYKMSAPEGKKAKEDFIARTIDEDIKRIESTPKPKYFYPLYDSCMVMTVPDNVQQDYLDGAFETLELILNAPDNPHEPFEAIPSELKSAFLKRVQDSARKKQEEIVMERNKEAEDNKKTARKVLADLERRFPGRKAKGAASQIAVPDRLDPSMFNSEQDLLQFEVGDKVKVKFGTGFRVPKKYAGRSLTFLVNNAKEYEYRIKSKVLVLTLESKPKDVMVIHPTDRFECLMIDLFPCNRRPYAGWRNKKVTLKKVG